MSNIGNCKECNSSLEGKPAAQMFCSRSCGVIFNNKIRVFSKETRDKIRKAAIKNSKSTRKIKNIFDMSSRTMSKVLSRLNIGCSNCGWNEGSCDIHHIKGRKIKNPHNHKNLCLLCPNCHRLVHEGKIDNSVLKSMKEILPDNWKDSYYG